MLHHRKTGWKPQQGEHVVVPLDGYRTFGLMFTRWTAHFIEVQSMRNADDVGHTKLALQLDTKTRMWRALLLRYDVARAAWFHRGSVAQAPTAYAAFCDAAPLVFK